MALSGQVWGLGFRVQGLGFRLTRLLSVVSFGMETGQGSRAAFDLLILSREDGNIIKISPYSQMRTSKSKKVDDNSYLGLTPKPLTPNPHTLKPLIPKP